MLSLIFKLIPFLLLSAPSFALELFDYNQTVRQLGMGGVYVFYENDAASIYQNPAYTCRTKGINWTIASVQLGANGLQTYNRLKGADFSAGLTEVDELYGTDIWLGGGGNTTFGLPCFGTGVYDNMYASLRLDNPVLPSLTATYLNDVGFVIGGGIPFNDQFSIGISAKRITRQGENKTLGPGDLIAIAGSSSDVATQLKSYFDDEGTAWGLDAGMLYRLDEVPFNPAVSVMWKDVGSTAFVQTKGDSAPPRIKDNLVLGMTFNSDIPLVGIGGGIEYRHITDQGEPFAKKFHMGLEANLAFLTARAGFNQGYTTYGLSVDMWLFQFDAAMYSVEKGAYAGQTEDQRIQVGILFDLGFDPDLNIFDMRGNKRRLKQRR